MKVQKKSTGSGPYAKLVAYEYESKKYEADIKDGDVITLSSSGEEVEGKYGTKQVFRVATRNGEKNVNVNQTSINNLIDAFGDDTEDWVGKEVQCWVVKTMVSGKLHNVLYLAPEGWSMDDEGNFTPGEEGTPF